MPDANMPDLNSDKSANPDKAADGKAGHRGVWITLLVLVVLAAGAGWWWWEGRTPPQAQTQAQPPMPVPVVIVAPRTVPVYRSFPATTEAVRSVTIQARVTGYLVERGAEDGSYVQAGALLYRIDPRDYQATLAQAQGQQKQSIASLSYSRASQRRNQTLARDGWTSRDNADKADSTLQQDQANLATTTASVQAAALNLSRTEIRAPFAGQISHSQVFQGQPDQHRGRHAEHAGAA